MREASTGREHFAVALRGILQLWIPRQWREPGILPFNIRELDHSCSETAVVGWCSGRYSDGVRERRSDKNQQTYKYTTHLALTLVNTIQLQKV
jgi:hypothetical protein